MIDQEHLAGRGRRLLATGVDFVLVPALTLVLIMLTGVVEHAEDYRSLAWIWKVFGLAVTSYLILNGYLLWRRGQSIGKALMGIAIVSTATGEKAPFWKLVGIRALFFPLLYLIPPPLTVAPVLDQVLIFMKGRRCLHDYAAGTSVVKRA